MTTKILRRREVQQIIGLSCSFIYASMNRGTFPAPVRLGPKSVGWRKEDVDAWLAARETCQYMGTKAAVQ
ncbi:transcriptional regulator, AlpA family [Burkholderia sp. WP9]|uniref:helix-turn-helix transcriptional regulator n=1 Tax=Burkholderia sp. WP9 TaxID=1500263 RepID=UPI00089C4601|nr:AlpA family phage regulatory protein [Burkholderia sp. WP9]SEE00461.1 transcriptional regulator, AlpA family [Burkholderia sp. WP9]